MSRRKTAPPPTPAREPAPRPWPAISRTWASHYTHSIREAAAWTLTLPPVQRGIVWTSAQQLALVDAVWHGHPIPPLVVVRTGDRRWLLDGQQRATALGLDVRAADGERRPAPPTRFDMQAGRWSLTEGEPVTLAELTDGTALHTLLRRGVDDDEWERRVTAYADACDCRITTLELDAHQLRDRDLRDLLRSLTVAGVPWTDAELDRLAAGWAP